MGSTTTNKEVVTEIIPIIKVYKDGTIDRPIDTPYAPPSPYDPNTGVSSKDITISPNISARLYLPPNPSHQKLPILIYFHGGGFCFESAFSIIHHNFLTSLVAASKALAVNVEYRQAPEHFLPAAYEDCWAAIQWVASHSLAETVIEPWLTKHADFTKLFLGGDSAGGNIVHNICLKLGNEELIGNVKVSGAFLTHPYFWGSKPIGSELSKVADFKESLPYRCWLLSYPGVAGGLDNPMVNPWVDGAPNLAGLAVPRMLVSVAEKDELRDRGVEYYKAVKQSGWKGQIELVEDKGEGHYFHVDPNSPSTPIMIKRLASFIIKSKGC